jgi:hypothetical protein
MHQRILFCLKWRVVPYDGASWGWIEPGTPTQPGAKLLSHGLNNSCRFVVDMLNEAGVEAKLVQVADDNEIWKEIVAYDPTMVVLEAYWARPKKITDLAARFPGLPIVVRGHSSTPFLAEDSVGFPWALGYLNAGAAVGQNDMRHVEEMRFLARSVVGLSDAEARDRVPYLPNYYPLERGPISTKPNDGEFVDVGCFGAIRSLKNHVGQAIAAMMFAERIGRRLRFHINGDRLERGGQAVSMALEALFADGDHELVRHAWIPTHVEFLALVAEMDLVTQVSFAETFNIVAADAASQGVPLVTSAEIPWGSPFFRASPTDVADIAHKMHAAWEMRFLRRDNPNRLGLKDFDFRARQAWLAFLED